MIFRNIIFIFMLILLFSCNDSDEIELNERSVSFKINHNFNLLIASDTVKFNAGIWMFKEKKATINSIANWINIKHFGKTILEPINVVWIDFKATNKTEATNNIVAYLEENKFVLRNGSSTGYYGLFDYNKWIGQHKQTWSDNINPVTTNNHGRIFLAHALENDVNETYFISTGAFSIESPEHYFVSFNNALHQFKETKEWSIFKDNLKIGNIYNTNDYTTIDHEGVKILVLR